MPSPCPRLNNIKMLAHNALCTQVRRSDRSRRRIGTSRYYTVASRFARSLQAWPLSRVSAVLSAGSGDSPSARERERGG